MRVVGYVKKNNEDQKNYAVRPGQIATTYYNDEPHVNPNTGGATHAAAAKPVYLNNPSTTSKGTNSKTNAVTTTGSSGGGSSASTAVSDYQGMLDDLYNKVMGYGGYSYTPYTPGTYNPTIDTSGTQAALKAAMGDIQGYGDFQYDLNSDLLYQQAVDNYAMLGQQAMADATANAAAMTGGYGNSYAASVGNQAYQNYITQANNMIPQFQQMALNTWQSGLDRRMGVYDAVSQQLANELSLEDVAFAIWAQNEANAANAHSMNSQGAYNSWLAGYNQMMEQYNLGVDYIGQLQALQKSSGNGGGSSTSNKTQSTNDKIVSAILGGNSNLNPNNSIVGGALVSNPMTNQAYLDYLEELKKL